MIEFSVPLLFADDFVDSIIKVNDEVTKSKITSVYNCFPKNLPNKTGFEQVRVPSIKGIETEKDFFCHVKKAQDAGLEFIYVLNSPKGVTPEEFYKNTDNVDRFIENLLKNNINIVRVTNTQLIKYLAEKYPEIEIRTSTSQEYTNIKQFKNLFEIAPQITEVVPSWDLNKNFEFLKSFSTLFPSQKIELMVNEGCLPGCPFRTHHNASLETNKTEVPPNCPARFYLCFKGLCGPAYYKNFWESFCLSNIIYPWQINTYVEKYGITKFKLVGRNASIESFRGGEYFNLYKAYLKGIEDYDAVKNVPIHLLSHYTITFNKIQNKYGQIATVEDVKDYLPSIEYFEANGHKCKDICGIECNYCYNLAKKLNKDFPLRLNDMR